MEFEWDAIKEADNLRKHRVSFTEAVESFFDPDGLLLVDEKHSGWRTDSIGSASAHRAGC
jgi:uncharacterized DUF497 family protein